MTGKIDISRFDHAAVLAEARRRFAANVAGRGLEELITLPEGFGLTTATPLQRAICRIIDGKELGELRDHPHVKEAVGDCREIDGRRPTRVILACCTRGGKSLISSGAGIRATQVADMGFVGKDEPPARVSVVSTSKDNADVIMKYITGNLLGRDGLKGLLLQPPKADEVLIRGNYGRPTEIKVVSGSRAGATLVSRWSAGVLVDEAAKMLSAGEGVVNIDDARQVSYSRLLPGAQFIEISSPWLPVGSFYQDTSSFWGGGPNFGKVFASPDLVVIRATGPKMNPRVWTPRFMDTLRRADPMAYQRDCMAEFVDADDSFFTQAVLRNCMDSTLMNPSPPERGCEYAACMDPATRGNAWTLVITTKKAGIKYVVGLYEWRGNTIEPLSPRKVLAEIASILRRYSLSWCFTDQWAADAFVDLASEEGLDLLVEQRKRDDTARAFLALLLEMQSGRVRIPIHEGLRRDLTLVRKIASPSPPGFKVVLPVTSDGRHCDFAPALVGAMMRWIDDQELPEGDADKTKIRLQEETERKARREEAHERKRRQMAGEEDPFDEPFEDDPILDGMRFL